MPRRTRYSSVEDESRRNSLAHAEHFRAFGEAITRAVDTYVSSQKSSEAELGPERWRQDLPFNLQDALEEFHRNLVDAPRRAMDVYYAEAPPEEKIEPRPRTGAARKPAASAGAETP
jgi:hypothetical protein